MHVTVSNRSGRVTILDDEATTEVLIEIVCADGSYRSMKIPRSDVQEIRKLLSTAIDAMRVIA